MKIVRKIGYALCGVFALLIAGEGVVRVRYFLTHHRETFWLVVPFQNAFGSGSATGFVALAREYDGRGARPCQNLASFNAGTGRTTRVTYDALCLRTAAPETHGVRKPAGVTRIAVVGDSTVFGFGVDDQETMPYLLEQVLNASPRRQPGVAYETINFGFGGSNAEDLLPLFNAKVFLYEPDLILYYNAVKDATNLDPYADDQLGGLAVVKNWHGSLHRTLYMKSMLDTYLTEKYYFRVQATRRTDPSELRVAESFERSLAGMISQAQVHRVPVVVIKQMMRAPLLIDSVDTSDAAAVKVLYERHVTDVESFEKRRDMFISINQRYVLTLTESIARSAGVPVLDFLRVFDEAGPTKFFVDYVHPNAEGNGMVASLIAEGLASHWPLSLATAPLSTGGVR